MICLPESRLEKCLEGFVGGSGKCYLLLFDGPKKCIMCGMERIAYIDKLVEWNKSSRRKPLILAGARQVGKTWLRVSGFSRSRESKANSGGSSF